KLIASSHHSHPRLAPLATLSRGEGTSRSPHVSDTRPRMIAFWVAAGLISAATAILILYRAAGAAGHAPADVSGVFYRRQLAEIADLAERGLIAESERRSA